MTIAIYRGRISEGANNLGEVLGATMLRTEGSRYRGAPDKLLVNWGNTGDEICRLQALTPAGNILNRPDAVARAVNKLTAFNALQDANVRTVPFCTNYDQALTLANSGRGRIYARTKLSGSSGEGIRLIIRPDDPQFNELTRGDIGFPIDIATQVRHDYSSCRLFTIGIVGKRHEWRVHVVNGRPILTQLKMKRAMDQRPAGYQSLVRNVDSGWIYSVNYERVAYAHVEAVEAAAVEAIAALGLDFGAVDIIQQKSDVYVLEVNTAPGLSGEGSAVQRYAEAFREAEQRLLETQE